MQLCFPELNSVRFAELIPSAHSQSTFRAGHSGPCLIPDPQPRALTPSKALVLDAAGQHHNTWVSDSWNAFSNPFVVHWVHFYYQHCFTVPNSQISSGSHSLSITLVASLVSLSSPCQDEDGKGHRCPRSHDLPDQTTTLLSPSCKAMVTWAKKLNLCTSKFLLSTIFPEQACLLSLPECMVQFVSPWHLCAHPTSILGFNVAGMEVRRGAWSGIKPGCSELIHQNF